MKLLSDIINELVDADGNLSSALLKTKVLASRIDNTALSVWVNNELDGYAVNDILPEYRISNARITMNFLIGNAHFKDQPIPMAGMAEQIRYDLQHAELRETIATLQSFLTIEKGKVLSMAVSAETIRYIDTYARQSIEYYPSFTITSVNKILAPHEAVGVLAIVRNRLLSFMLQIEKEFGSATDIETLKAGNQQISNIMYHTIINTGDGNTINTGNNSTVTAAITINKGDFSMLEKKLQELGLKKTDTDNLKDIIYSDTVDLVNKRYGPDVNKWMMKMLEKAIDGSWQIGIGTAGGVLAELLNSYYGIK